MMNNRAPAVKIFQDVRKYVTFINSFNQRKYFPFFFSFSRSCSSPHTIRVLCCQFILWIMVMWKLQFIVSCWPNSFHFDWRKNNICYWLASLIPVIKRNNIEKRKRVDGGRRRGLGSHHHRTGYLFPEHSFFLL